MNTETTLKFPSKILQAVLEAAAIARSSDVTRVVLQHVCIRQDDAGLEVVSTDGYQLYRINVTLPKDSARLIPAGRWLASVASVEAALSACKLAKKLGGKNAPETDVTLSLVEDGADWTFPEHSRAIVAALSERSKPSEESQATDERTIPSFNPALLSDVTAAAAKLKIEALRCQSEGAYTAMRCDGRNLNDWPFEIRLTAVVMPMRMDAYPLF